MCALCKYTITKLYVGYIQEKVSVSLSLKLITTIYSNQASPNSRRIILFRFLESVDACKLYMVVEYSFLFRDAMGIRQNGRWKPIERMNLFSTFSALIRAMHESTVEQTAQLEFLWIPNAVRT